ncbi:copper resistance CopC family protein [Oceanobacillus arenosus]|uniref:copper resistance CopC family protein n=1 Tax=Oceanobacillus arenosus TaxID=1229153 RepID=UPI001474B1FC|nr:copper resistance protein CopC [Oceanobacillus arenosus]
MKRIFIAAAAFLLVTCFAAPAFAHSHLHGSNPADGDVVTEPLNEIVLEFDGQIEEGSFIDITTTEGQAVELQDTIIGEGTLTGTVAEPLANDEYQVNWSIISTDGHPMEGEFSFMVDAPAAEFDEEAANSSETDVNEDSTDSADQVAESGETANSAEEESSSSMTVILIVVLVVIVIAGIFFISKRKK